MLWTRWYSGTTLDQQVQLYACDGCWESCLSSSAQVRQQQHATHCMDGRHCLLRQQQCTVGAWHRQPAVSQALAALLAGLKAARSSVVPMQSTEIATAVLL